MDQLRAQLEHLHAESFGWALCCSRRDRHRAEEVLQQTYVKVLSGKARFGGEGSFKTWLFAVIRVTARDEARRHWLGQFRFARFARAARDEVHMPPGIDEETAAVLEALQALPARQREALHLVFYQGLSIALAGDVMGVSVGAARTHYDRGKAALRRKLAGKVAFQQESDHESGRQPAVSLL
ncbi:MAG TPA: RNA polymerase sigma factor [Phycisphaerae bacterium]|jgi:RNA polymerase sigma-70 factor (ECF subfamily)|nr:RNA polymerase sigma factor [Phycisphaerae bacterium]